jgi:hypothetical protein
MKKINIIDLLAVVFLLGMIFLAFMLLTKKQETKGRPTLVTIRVQMSDTQIIPKIKSEKTIYFDSTLNPVEQVEVQENYSLGKVSSVDITVKGRGIIENERYLFNGLRVLVNQKAELHGKYFVQSAITEIKYAD